MSETTVSTAELKKVQTDINEIKVELEPIKQAIPMLVSLQKESLEVQKSMAIQQEKNSNFGDRLEKAENLITNLSEKQTDILIQTKANSLKIAMYVSVAFGSVSLIAKYFIL